MVVHSKHLSLIIPFWAHSCVGPRNHVTDGAVGATGQIRLINLRYGSYYHYRSNLLHHKKSMRIMTGPRDASVVNHCWTPSIRCARPHGLELCRTTSAHSRTMSPSDRVWKPGFSPDTSVFSALETFVIIALYINLHLPYHTIPSPLFGTELPLELAYDCDAMAPVTTLGSHWPL